MSFLLGGGRSQVSSAEKIAAAETEIEMVSDMFSRYVASVEHCPNSLHPEH
jgi:hypothetical protein